MTIQRLCELIELQDSVVDRVNQFIETYNFSEIEATIEALTCPETAEEAYKRLTEVFPEDEDQMKMLTCQLLAAQKTYAKYQEKNISEQIYVDTMKCFTRFIGECKVKTGREDFDRAWWTYRQLSGVILRIGELEYELREENATRKVDIHIPSDAKFTPEMVDESLGQAQAFLEKYYPKYVGCDFVCESWLLSPKLKEVLSAESNIIRFQNRFTIVKEDENAEDIFEWVFQTSPECGSSRLKENTTLQKKIKQLLLRGEKVGIAWGVLK